VKEFSLLERIGPLPLAQAALFGVKAG